MSKLVLMGSGETAPSLVGVHRQMIATLDSPRCGWLDTPYGFQENADILSAKTAEFFSRSLTQQLGIIHFRNAGQPEVERQLAYSATQQYNYLFSGPGSPSYALQHWSRSEFPNIFLEKLRREDEILVFASAAACTLGALCLPVYEIYKVGQDPHWLPGLDILPRLGYPAVILPHYNNTVGGNHDTRFCYLGERRLSLLEEQLQSDLWIWGIDEHTALILDFDNQQFEVHGKGGFTLRRRGQSKVFESDSGGSLLLLSQPGSTAAAVTPVPAEAEQSISSGATQAQVLEQVQPLAEIFQQSLVDGDGLAAAQALLEFEQLLSDWSGDSDVHHWQIARSLFRNLLAQLGQSAQRGLRDPSAGLAPFVESLLHLREQSRLERQFERADWIRQSLVGAGIDVQDTPQGTRWSLRTEPSVN